MKTKLLSFLKRYYGLIILSLLHPLAMATSDIWGHIYLWDTSLGSTYTYDYYFLILAPILHLIYGCIVCLITKKLLVSLAIPSVVYLVYFGSIYFKEFEDSFYPMLLFAIIPLAFYLVSATVTSAAREIYNDLKAAKKRSR